MTESLASKVCRLIEQAIDNGILCDEVDEAIRILDQLEGDCDYECERLIQVPRFEPPTYQLCLCCGHLTREDDGDWQKEQQFRYKLFEQAQREWRELSERANEILIRIIQHEHS